MSRPLLVPVLLLLCGAPLAAQEPEPEGFRREITFRDALELGLAYNYGLQSARLRALIQRFSVIVEDAAWDPVVESSIRQDRFSQPTRSQLGGADVLDTDQTNFVFGVTQPLRIGPSLGLNWRTDRTYTNSSFNTINPAYDSSLELSLTVPLLQGRGRLVQEASLRRARAGLEAERQALSNDVAVLIGDVASAYWGLVALQGRVKVLERSLAVARDVEATEARLLELGRSTPLDVTIAHSETKRREATLIQGQRDAEDAADELRVVILPFTGARSDLIELIAIQQPDETAPIAPLGELVRLALDRRPDLLQIDAQIMQQQESVILADNETRIDFDLVASVGWTGVSEDLSESVGDAISGKNTSAGAGLNLSWPLGRRAALANLRRSQLELERRRIERRDKANTVIAEVREAHRALRVAILEVETIREEERAAEASLAGERKRLARGSSTIIDVSRLEENLTDARLRLLEASTTLELARVAIHRVSGTLLDHYQIVFGADFQPLRSEDSRRDTGQAAD